jgi:hypothetical protein
VIQNGVQAAIVGLWFVAGAAIEVLNAWTRRWAAEQLAPERRAASVGWFVGGFVLRVVLTAGVLVLAFRHSLASGLAAWLGYYVCRMVLIGRLSRRLERGSGQRSGKGESSIGSGNG